MAITKRMLYYGLEVKRRDMAVQERSKWQRELDRLKHTQSTTVADLEYAAAMVDYYAMKANEKSIYEI